MTSSSASSALRLFMVERCSPSREAGQIKYLVPQFPSIWLNKGPLLIPREASVCFRGVYGLEKLLTTHFNYFFVHAEELALHKR